MSSTCAHSYMGDYRQRGPRGMGIRCPHPEIYDRARAARSENADGPPIVLPCDEQGVCIFHSRDVGWKSKNDFPGRFLELVRLLGEDDAVTYFDFAEFVFVGRGGEGADAHPLEIDGEVFAKKSYFTGATFLHPLRLNQVDFRDGASFEGAAFERELEIMDARLRGIDFIAAEMKGRTAFFRLEVPSYALFRNARFSGTVDGRAVLFEDCRFGSVFDFSDAELVLGAESSALFVRVRFEDFVDFRQTLFRCHTVFEEVSFSSQSEFVDTVFATVSSSARFRGAAVELSRIQVGAGATLLFQSTDAGKKMFDQDVQISFEGDPAGIIRFENVNFSKLTTASRDRLTRLTKSGRVEIGSGCIKYRFQTPLRSIVISHGNDALVVEICQTFANYFTATSGLNLGVEIVERDNAKIRLFYFTDEDITEAMFTERLKHTEQSLWDLLSHRPREELRALEAVSTGEVPLTQPSWLIGAVDGLSALMGTFFRVGARIALGRWQAADTRALLSAVEFESEGAEARAHDLHRVLVAKYTGSSLFGISNRQNALLLTSAFHRPDDAAVNVNILFVGANVEDQPQLDLAREVGKIEAKLGSSRRHDLVFHQQQAATVDDLTDALVDCSPTVVHFSGHGKRSGILLRDESGAAKEVSGEALARLFGLFKETVRCVVLSSCYSQSQAQAIRAHIPYVVGMSSSIPDRAAIAFSAAFYKALGAGREIPWAYDLGKAAIELEGVRGVKVPILL